MKKKWKERAKDTTDQLALTQIRLTNLATKHDRLGFEFNELLTILNKHGLITDEHLKEIRKEYL